MLSSAIRPYGLMNSCQCGRAFITISRHDRLAELAAGRAALQRPHRLVVAHVVVDAELHPGLVAEPHHLDRLLERERDGLLRQDPLHVGPLHGLAHDLELLVGREGDVDDLDALVVEQLLPGVVDRLDAALLGRRLRVRRRPRGDRDDVEPRLRVGDEVDVLHDEAGADAADPVVGLRRQVRPGVEVDGSPCRSLARGRRARA